MLNLTLPGLGVASQPAAGFRGFLDRTYRSYGGHVALRVPPGGSTYEVVILNDADQSRELIRRFGPYQANRAGGEAS